MTLTQHKDLKDSFIENVENFLLSWIFFTFKLIKYKQANKQNQEKRETNNDGIHLGSMALPIETTGG